ncbi:hypothetical protein, partial [Photorhabdus africana]|uniref:hypothetical protein n=1 Tax=Photorhabdus africana TaxID=3097554 RepID=UPI002B40D527
AYLLICLFAYLLICLFAYLLICLFAYLLICLFAYLLNKYGVPNYRWLDNVVPFLLCWTAKR